MRVRGLLLSALLVVTTLGTAPIGASAAPGPGRDDGLRLSGPVGGKAAIRALGKELPRVAQLNRMSPTRLTAILAGDHTARVDSTGRLSHLEDVAPAPDEPPAVAAAALPLDQTFALHSRPGADRVIFLDFDGTLVSGTGWNDQYALTAREYAGWSLDTSAAFSAEELAQVQQIWQRVAEDFAALDVDVTTADPGSGELTRTTSSDGQFGMHVALTDDPEAPQKICGSRCSGIAYVDVFDQLAGPTSYQPALVFGDLSYDDPQVMADAISHEVGHTLGLAHDGVVGGPSYYAGQGVWQPIMGSGWAPLSQFDQGEYSGADNRQDDYAVMTSNGVALRTDDHPDTADLGTIVPASGQVAGTITTRDDVDWFTFEQACIGQLAVVAAVVDSGPNLDIRMRVLSGTGAVLADVDPPAVQQPDDTLVGLDAQFTGDAGPGSYRIGIEGVGQGDPRADGYSDYGTRGSYTVDVTSTCAARTASTTPGTPTGVQVAPAADGRSATVTWSPPTSDGGSPVTRYDVTSDLPSSATLAATTRSHRVAGLAPGQSYTFAVTASNATGSSLPVAVTATMPGPAGSPEQLTAESVTPASVTVSWQPPADDGGVAIDRYRITSGTSVQEVPATSDSATIRGLAPDTVHTVEVSAGNAAGWGPVASVDVRTLTATPGPVSGLALSRRSATTLTVVWKAPSHSGASALTRYEVRRDGRSWTRVSLSSPSYTFSRLLGSTGHTVSVRAVNADGAGAVLSRRFTTSRPTRPTAPRIRWARSGASGGLSTATAAWAAPLSNGGARITSYRVTALRLSARGTVAARVTRTATPAQRRLVMRLPRGSYRFQVAALNKVGISAGSARSNRVVAR
ncbi:MAG TPA: fibronectin type III domain-containing protein [Marmoricola sp.]|nr:fibronectin type III domain-containing protein [Marmoricola sp.]